MMKQMKIFIFLAISIIILVCRIAQAECLIIVNKSVKETSINEKDVKLIFLCKKIKWSDGQNIQPLRLMRGELHEYFLDKFIQKTQASYMTYWRQAFATGSAIPPKVMQTEKDVVAFVMKCEGAVGYISSDTPHEDVKVLSIE